CRTLCEKNAGYSGGEKRRAAEDHQRAARDGGAVMRLMAVVVFAVVMIVVVHGIDPCQSGVAAAKRCFRWSDRRIASATSVSVGFTVEPVGKSDDPAMKRFDMPCTRQSASTTPCF